MLFPVFGPGGIWLANMWQRDSSSLPSLRHCCIVGVCVCLSIINLAFNVLFSIYLRPGSLPDVFMLIIKTGVLSWLSVCRYETIFTRELLLLLRNTHSACFRGDASKTWLDKYTSLVTWKLFWKLGNFSKPLHQNHLLNIHILGPAINPWEKIIRCLDKTS